MLKVLNPEFDVTVKPFEPEDVPYLESWMYREEYADFFRDMLSLTREQIKIYSYMKDGQAFMIRHRKLAQDHPIGFIVLYEMRPVAGNLKMAILIEERFRKQSFCFEVMRGACDYAFNRMRYHKVIIELMARNTELQASCAKGGFAKEATLIQEANVNGVFEDVIRMVMFRDDFVKNSREGFYGK